MLASVKNLDELRNNLHDYMNNHFGDSVHLDESMIYSVIGALYAMCFEHDSQLIIVGRSPLPCDYWFNVGLAFCEGYLGERFNLPDSLIDQYFQFAHNYTKYM